MKKRFETRRHTALPMEVITSDWDEPVELTCADLSPRGAFITSPLVPGMGEHIICSFKLGKKKAFDFFGQVVRVNLGRRKNDGDASGFGVQFLDATPLDRIRIRESLRGTPPPVPKMRAVKKSAPATRKPGR